jgi:hypothetical protein
MQKSIRKPKVPSLEAPRYPSRSKDPLQAGVNPLDLVHQLRFSLEQEWKSKSIPYALCEIYSGFISLLPHRKSVIFMQKELSDLRSYNSLVQVCLKGIHAREESLISIKEMCDYLAKASDWETLSDVRIECAEILHAHRMLTLNVVESIERWKEFFLFENPDFKANFVYNGMNYLEKIRHDLNFLPTSELSKAFKFSTESDPFLIRPSKVIEKHKTKPGGNYFLSNGQVIIPLPSLILKRVQKMDDLVKQESEFDFPKEKTIEKPVIKKKHKKNESKIDDLSLTKNIAEGIYREVISFVTFEIAQKEADDYIAKMISFDIEPVLNPCLQIIVAEVFRDITENGKNDDDQGESLNLGSSRENYGKIENQKIFREINDFPKISKKFEDSLLSFQEEEFKNSESSEKKIVKFVEDSGERSEYEKNNLTVEVKSYEKKHEEELKSNKEHQTITNDLPKHENSEKPKRPAETESERRSTQNAKRLQQFIMIEWIIRNMIELLIKEADFESIVNSSIKSILSEKSKNADNEEKRRLTIIVKTLESDKLNEVVYNSLVDSFVELEWLEQLALSLFNVTRNPNRKKTFETLLFKKPDLVVEEADDYALEVFTPGVHSPNHVLTEESEEDTPAKDSYTSDMLNRIISQGRKDGNYDLVPFNENLKNACKSFNQYLKTLSEKLKEINWPSENLFEILQFCEDCSWFWLKDESEITGCLIYSTIVQSTKKCSLVHHFSTTNPKNLRILLEKSQKLMSSHNCKKLIFNLNPKTTKELSSFLSITLSDPINFSFPSFLEPINHLSLDFPETFSFSSPILSFSLKISASSRLSFSEDSNPPDLNPREEMKKIGNRHCTLHAILSVLNKNEIPEESSSSNLRLQSDLLDILEIISTTEDFRYSFLKNFQEVQRSTSSFYLDLKFLNISSFSQVFEKVSYKFLKFLNVRSFKSEQYSFYEIDTNFHEISAFFLVYVNIEKELSREIKGCKSDLFGKVENLMKSLQESEKREDLVVPAFNVNVEWDLGWIRGLEVPFVGKVNGCHEKVEVRMEFTEPAPVSLKTSDCVLINGEFVFGLREKYLTKVLELPLFVSLITQTNWLLS